MKYYISENSNFLMHHGIKGQKWGERRFQNLDGTLTPEGIERYRQYVNDFGKRTADRLMKSHYKGLNTKQALEKEYLNRRNSTVLAPGAGAITGALAGTFIGMNASKHKHQKQGLTKYGILNQRDALDFSGPISGTIGAVIGGTGAIAINHIANGYKLGELSESGLHDFYIKMKQYYE